MKVSQSIAVTLRDGGSQPSPNSGWPEAAFAGALGVRLGGLNFYNGVAKSQAISWRRRKATRCFSVRRYSKAALCFVVPHDGPCHRVEIALELTHGGAIFAIAQERGWHWQEVLDFSANINPLGPAPGVHKAIIDALDEIVHYPDRYSSRLQRALAEDWDIDPERILLGNGATELIHFVARVWPAKPALVTPVFSEFHRAYPSARLIRHGDAWPDEEFVVVTNPMNPTGAAVDVPDRAGDTLIDESFIDFTDLPTRIHSHNIVLRSLTKFHALPGLRIGALVGPGDFIRLFESSQGTLASQCAYGGRSAGGVTRQRTSTAHPRVHSL